MYVYDRVYLYVGFCDTLKLTTGTSNGPEHPDNGLGIYNVIHSLPGVYLYVGFCDTLKLTTGTSNGPEHPGNGLGIYNVIHSLPGVYLVGFCDTLRLSGTSCRFLVSVTP